MTFRSSENLCAGRGYNYNLVIVIADRPRQAMHAGGGDDRQPPCGLFLLISCVHIMGFA